MAGGTVGSQSDEGSSKVTEQTNGASYRLLTDYELQSVRLTGAEAFAICYLRSASASYGATGFAIFTHHDKRS